MKTKKTKNPDDIFEGYFTETNAGLHRKAIKELLGKVDLENNFDKLLKQENELENFFLMWEEAGELDNSVDKKGLQNLGELSKKFYNKKQYKKLYNLFFDVMLGSFAEFAKLKERSDFDNLTDQDLYEKEIIPSEIFLQFFIIECSLKQPGFNWDRSEEVMKQNLACLLICFLDIYDFMNAEH